MESAFTKKRVVVYARANAFARYSIYSQILLCHAKMKNDQVEEIHPPIVDIASGKSTAGTPETRREQKHRLSLCLYHR